MWLQSVRPSGTRPTSLSSMDASTNSIHYGLEREGNNTCTCIEWSLCVETVHPELLLDSDITFPGTHHSTYVPYLSVKKQSLFSKLIISFTIAVFQSMFTSANNSAQCVTLCPLLHRRDTENVFCSDMRSVRFNTTFSCNDVFRHYSHHRFSQKILWKLIERMPSPRVWKSFEGREIMKANGLFWQACLGLGN